MAQRNLNLDILRMVSVLLVIGHHFEICPLEVNQTLFYLTTIWQRGGWIGVNIFFVLSGFLISSLIFREYQKTGGFSVKTFLIRRGLKIYPSFYVLLAVTVFINLVVLHKPFVENARFYAGELFFFQNYLGGLWVHTWSLAVEEHFYFGLALLCFYFINRRNKAPNRFAAIPKVFAATLCFCMVGRIFAAYFFPLSRRMHIVGTHVNIDNLFFGVLIGYFYHFYSERFAAFAAKYRIALLAVGLLLLTPAFIFEKEQVFMLTFYPPLLYTGAGLLLVGFLFVELNDSRINRSLAYFGSFSYSIYLWQTPLAALVCVPLFIASDATRNWYLYAASFLGLSFIVGVAAAKLIEYPVVRFRDRVFPSKINSPLAAPAIGLDKRGNAMTEPTHTNLVT